MFWFFVLVISLAIVLLTAMPLLRALRGARKADGAEASMRLAALVAICIAPPAAALVYLQIGEPVSLSTEFQAALNQRSVEPAEEIAALPADERTAVIESMVAGLAERLATEPDDPEGWRMLARSYGVLNRAEESAAAYRELIARDENASTEDWRNFALSLLAIEGGNGVVSDEALAVLNRIHSIDQNDALALFYLGMAARERGAHAEALQRWRKLIDVLPDDAPILLQLHSLIDELAAENG